MQAIFETAFDILYLCSVVAIGVYMLAKGRERQYKMAGAMAVLLGAGDAFHLVPRAIALCTTGLEAHATALGVGKLVTSITMTIFYVLLYAIWQERYGIRKKELTYTVWSLAALRIILCLFPQNQWLAYQGPLSWGIYRNIPFALMGLLVIVLFYRQAKLRQDRRFRFMWLAVLLSFGFYIPVVLFAEAVPLIGMLMIPKTLAYVWAICMPLTSMLDANRKPSE